jgi:tetratricopeptide (TPR) repeat protein
MAKLSDAEKTTLSSKITGYCSQGSDALANNDLSTAEKMFLLGSQQPSAEDLPDTARALEGLAFIQYKQKQYDKAADNLKQAITIYEEQPRGNFNSALVRPLYQLASIYNIQGKTADEKAALTQAVDVGARDASNRSQHVYVLSLMDLGMIYQKENQLLSAEALLRRALDLQQQSRDQEGLLPTIVNDLAKVLDAEGRRSTANILRSNQSM